MADDQKMLKKRLKVLMGLPYNQVCSDCTERQPRWASLIVPPPGAPPGSLAIGALCCLECSGSHRRLGVHISFVRSINLDSWKEKEVLAMENGGNAKVNAIFEARLPNASVKPSNHADGSTRERYIRDKYERRKYYDPSGFDAYAASSSAAAPPSNGVAAVADAAVGPPSDAAKQRLEQRRARINQKSASTVDEAAAATAATTAAPRRKVGGAVAKAPVSAPPPTMDLLDLMGSFGDEPAAQTSNKPAVNANAVATASMDLFDFGVADEQQQQPALAPVQPKAAASLDIMSLYNNTGMSQQQQQQQQQHRQFNNGGGAMYTQFQPSMMMANAVSGGGMPMMQQQQQQQQPQPQHGGILNNAGMNQNGMHQMTNAMHNLNFTSQQQLQMYQQQQQQYQQQQMMLMQQQQQQQQMMMMMQQQQQTNVNPSNMMGGGGSMPPGPSRPNATPEKEDPFAQFGTNAFRS